MGYYRISEEIQNRNYEILTDKEINHINQWPELSSYWQCESDGDIFSFKSYQSMVYAIKFLKRIRPDLVVKEKPSYSWYLVSVTP